MKTETIFSRFLQAITLNKISLTLILFFAISSLTVSGQTISRLIHADKKVGQQLQSETLNFSINKAMVQSWGIRIDGLEDPHHLSVNYKIKYPGQAWSEMKTLTGKEDLMDTPHKWISALQFLDESASDSHKKVQFRFFLPANKPFAKAEIFFIQVNEKGRKLPQPHLRSSCQKPQMLDRSEWCEGNCPPDPDPVPTHQEFMIVHHSASSNTSSNWAAVVESFYNYHTQGNGWDDIGYNWLVDPNGVIYIGRGDEVKGAHFCAQNSGTAGICVIGTYTDVYPTDEAMTSLKKLLGWKMDKENLDPLASAYHPSSGKTIPRITGHRIACSTECPGDKLFSLLQTFPVQVKNYIDKCDGVVDSEIHLEASLQLDATVLLQWEIDTTSPTLWEIYRKDEGVYFTKVGEVSGDKRQWLDVNVDYNQNYTYFVKVPETENSSNRVQVYTHLDDVASGFLLYPNPARDVITIQLVNDVREGYEITLYDMQGHLVQNIDFPATVQKEAPIMRHTLNLSSLQAGMYILKMTGESFTTKKKIVIQ